VKAKAAEKKPHSFSLGALTRTIGLEQ